MYRLVKKKIFVPSTFAYETNLIDVTPVMVTLITHAETGAEVKLGRNVAFTWQAGNIT